MVDTALASLGVHVEPLQVVVEINVASAKISPEKGSVRGKNSGHINATAFTQGHRDTCQPLVELHNNSSGGLVGDILGGISPASYHDLPRSTYLSEKPCNNISKYNGLVCLLVARWRGDASCGPQISFPLVHVTVCGFGIEQQYSRSAINKPSSI